MKNKIIKMSLILLGIILIILGIVNIIKFEVSAIQGNLNKVSSSTGGTLAAGETDPSKYSYNVNPGSFWASSANSYGIPNVSGYQIYCINPGSPLSYKQTITYADAAKHIGEWHVIACRDNGCASKQDEGEMTLPLYTEAGTYDLPVAAAYIVSDEPIGEWSEEKQRAIWNLRDTSIHDSSTDEYEDADENMIIGSANSSHSGPSIYDQEAKDYAEYDKLVRNDGLNSTDKTDVDELQVLVDTDAEEYLVGPFNVEYTSGASGDVVFSGISDIQIIGYNKNKEKVEIEIPIKGLSLKDEATGIYGELITPEYFEPSEDLKVDETEQLYPASGQDFKVVFDDPNEDIEDEDDKVKYISIKVKFKYMLANGKYTKLKGTKYVVAYKCDHTYNVHNYTHYDQKCEGEDCQERSVDCDEDCPDDCDEEHTEKYCPGKHRRDHSGCKTTGYLATKQQQWLMAADAIRSIYEEEVELVKDGVRIGMDLGGNVWEDLKAGKENVVDGIYGKDDLPVEGIPVILHTEDGEVVARTKTDEDGEYVFEDLDPMKKYYVEFQYNGQQYQNTIYTNDLSGGYSNATESVKDRDAFNEKFEEIDGDEGYTLDQVNYEDGDRDYTPDDPFGISAYTGSDGEDKLQIYPKYNQFVIGEKDVTIGKQKYEAIYEDGDSQREVDFGITERIEFDMSVKKDVYIATVKVNGKTVVYGYDKRNVGEDDWEVLVNSTDISYERGISNDDYNFAGQNGNTEGLLEVYVTYKIAVRNQSQSMLGHVTKLYDYYDSTYEYVPELSWVSSTSYRTNDDTLNSLQDAMHAEDIDDDWGTEPNVIENRNDKLTIDLEKKQSTGETIYLYLTFKVDGEGQNVSLGEKANRTEIGSFITYYAKGTVLPHYGENNYVIPDNNTIAGRVDRDSIPSSMGAKGSPVEDDEEQAPGINVKITGEERKLNGTVWEDQREVVSGEAVIGNGLKEDGEIGISGVTVQLIEKTVNGTDYVWQETKTDENGKYKFEGYVAGDYFVRFYYGDSVDTVATSENHPISYNGQDYKSTTYQVGVTQNEYTDIDNNYKGYKDVNTQNESKTYGYDIAEAEGKNVSDAKDLWTTTINDIENLYYDSSVNSANSKIVQGRLAVNNWSNNEGNGVTNSLAEILASPYEAPTNSSTDRDVLIQELINNTYMTAETGIIVVEIEKNMQTNLENGVPSYALVDIDFGLTERPKAQLEIDKSISNVKVTLANNTVLFDVNKSGDNVIWKTHESYNLASKKDNGKYEEYYGVANKNRYSYRYANDYPINKADKGLIQLTMDEELMHGATIQIIYKVKVTNVSEMDYEGQKFYYLGDSTGATQVTTVAHQIVDYVANNLKYDSSATLNEGWELTDKDSLVGQDLVNSVYDKDDKLGKFNTIIQTDDLNQVLKPGESSNEKTLMLTQLISTQNTSDDLTYSNMVEIIKISNSVGRRMAYSIVGNQDPTESKASEVDASVAEKVIILPPFGDTPIFYILIATIGIILAGGITFIIRKVLKK